MRVVQILFVVAAMAFALGHVVGCASIAAYQANRSASPTIADTKASKCCGHT
jgi:hypothetical protein